MIYGSNMTGVIGALNLLAKFTLHSGLHLAASRHTDTLTSLPPRLHFLHDLMNSLINVSGRIARHPQQRMLFGLLRRLLCILVSLP